MISILTSSSDTSVSPQKLQQGIPFQELQVLGMYIRNRMSTGWHNSRRQLWSRDLQLTEETESAVLHDFPGSPGSDRRYGAITTSSQSTPAQKC